MLKNLKPISLILLAGALSYPVASHAGITPGQPNVDFSQQSGKIPMAPTTGQTHSN